MNAPDRADTRQDIDLVSFVEEARRDAQHAFNFLRETGTLSASLTFHVSRCPLSPIIRNRC